MQHIAILIACIFFCYGCDPAPGIFLANRSGSDKVIYITGRNYRLLKDGYDITFRPLRASFFNKEKLYIGDDLGIDSAVEKSGYLKMKEYGNVRNLMEQIESYYDSTGKKATFIISKDEVLKLKEHDEPPNRMPVD